MNLYKQYRRKKHKYNYDSESVQFKCLVQGRKNL